MNKATEKVYIIQLVLCSIISFIHNEYYPKKPRDSLEQINLRPDPHTSILI